MHVQVLELTQSLGFLENFSDRFPNIFSTFGTNHWTKGRPVARPVPTQKSPTQKYTDKRSCLEWDLNPQSHCWRNEDRATAVVSRLK